MLSINEIEVITDLNINYEATITVSMSELFEWFNTIAGVQEKTTEKEISRWLAKKCPHYPLYRRARFECPRCMSVLKKSLKTGEGLPAIVLD